MLFWSWVFLISVRLIVNTYLRKKVQRNKLFPALFFRVIMHYGISLINPTSLRVIFWVVILSIDLGSTDYQSNKSISYRNICSSLDKILSDGEHITEFYSSDFTNNIPIGKDFLQSVMLSRFISNEIVLFFIV